MNELIRESIKTLLLMLLVILVTHALFFMIYGYYVSGNPFIALMNFYENMYNIRW